MHCSKVAGRQFVVPHSSGSARPAIDVPPGAADCHHHIYDPDFPFPVGQASEIVATVDQYQEFKKRLGIERSVVVAASDYGHDNRYLIHALERLGSTARGVAIAPLGVSDRALDALQARGIRGLRFYLSRPGRPSPASLATLADRLRERGWHMDLAIRGAEIQELSEVLASLSCPVVIDHFGQIPQPAAILHPAFETLRMLLARGGTWVKLSAPYMTSLRGRPFYEDIDDLAKSLIRCAPERILWGSDWPHPRVTAQGDLPDDALLLDRLAEWASDTSVVHRILVSNPAELYWHGLSG